jgi:hypothetical protein
VTRPSKGLVLLEQWLNKNADTLNKKKHLQKVANFFDGFAWGHFVQKLAHSW